MMKIVNGYDISIIYFSKSKILVDSWKFYYCVILRFMEYLLLNWLHNIQRRKLQNHDLFYDYSFVDFQSFMQVLYLFHKLY